MAKSWRDSIPSKWLKAADLDGKPHLFTIKKFTVETVGEKRRPVIWFAEDDRGLGLNITNGQSIEKIAGSADPEKWIGKRIVAYPTETDFKGERVDCIRIRAPRPGAKLPPPPEPEPGPVEVEPIEEGEEYRATDEDVPF